ALPFDADGRGLRKAFQGDSALQAAGDAPHTLAFVGRDLRKVTLPAKVRNSDGQVIGDVLTCVTDMAIGRAAERVFSVASPEAPDDFKAAGLSCGFVKVVQPLPAGTPLELEDKRRRIPVRIVDDVRPDRTARKPLKAMI
ncbi:MAG: aminomethyl transferase family protein, partial [Desulfosarcina sp.]|nr:aminomethyl transferase family protein [Desulfobacterales bacterium]